ncbi:MAG: diaminopimelate epimerase [Actinomycetota bacterium]
MTLTKHHGLGNDFLIAVDADRPLGPEHAVRWCHRRRGIGADGLIALHPTDHPKRWSMQLWNADGSVAELSGNGLRCVGQALLLHHDPGGSTSEFRIETAAGPRVVLVQPDRDSDTDLVTVDMGVPKVGPPPSPRWPSLGLEPNAQTGVDMGNPHLVALFDDIRAIDIASVGPAIESDYAQGLNVHVASVTSHGGIDMRIWERGVGATDACGTGACAAAWAANQWQMVGDKVEVEMPGGTALVEIDGEHVVLTGPATFVGLVEVTVESESP